MGVPARKKDNLHEKPILYEPYFLIPDKIVEVKFYGKSCVCYEVVISGEEYIICADPNRDMYYKTGKGAFPEGMLNSKDDPNRVGRIGFLGEFAFAKLFGLSVDLGFHDRGDQYDFLIALPTKEEGVKYLRIDFKTASMYRDRDKGRIICKKYDGANLELRKDIYVFGYVDYDNRQKREAKVVIVGYCTKGYIEKFHNELIEGVMTTYSDRPYFNKQVPFDELLPIGDLLKAYRQVQKHKLCPDIYEIKDKIQLRY